MAIGTMALARLLSPSEHGLYSASLVAPLLFALFGDWGINSARVFSVCGGYLGSRVSIL